MSGAEDEDELDELLTEVRGSTEALQLIAWWPERPIVARALFDASMPDNERFGVLGEELLNGADRPMRELIGEFLIQRSRRKAGNPKRADGPLAQLENLIMAAEAKRLYMKFLRQGRPSQGLKKAVSDAIGRPYGKKGSTVDKLWQIPGRKRRRSA